MISPSTPPKAYRFGPFRLSVSDRILERNGERIQLTPKVIDTLFVLVENARQVVTKEELMQAVWPDVTVVESGLTRNISALRKALEQGVAEGSFLETIPRRGYRFVADVTAEFEEQAFERQPATPVITREELRNEPPAKRKRSTWIAVAGAVLALSFVMTVTMLKNPVVEKARPAADPSVRIGEHLLYKLAPEETVRASEHFERAIVANPSSAGAHAGLAISLVNLSMLGVRPAAQVLPRAEQAAATSMKLDNSSVNAHYASGLLALVKNWDFRKADAEFRRALELDRRSVQTRLGYARLKLTIGEPAEAQRLVEEALQLDPASPPLGTEYCRVFYFLQDLRRAEAECRKVLDREPGYALAHYYLGLTQGLMNHFEQARESLRRSGLRPGVLEADYAWLSLREGDRKPAEAVLESRRELIRQGKVDATAKLLPASILGRMDDAYEAVEAGIARHAPELLTLHIEPRLEAIRADPRYSGVLRRTGRAQN